MAEHTSEHPWLLKNEYASVRVTVDTQGNGSRLKVEDLSTGSQIYLDPLELQSLAWATHKDLKALAQPAFKERALDRLAGRTPPDATLEAARAILEEQADED